MLTRNVELIAAGALVFVYLTLMNGHMQSIDGLLTYRQGESIAFSRSMQLQPPIWWGQWWTTSKFGIGLSLLYLPGLVVFSWLGGYVPLQHGATYDFRLLYSDPLYAIVGPPIQIIATAGSAYLVALVIRDWGFSRRIALVGLALYGLASPAIVYARSDISQPLTAFCWIAGLYCAIRFRRERRLWMLVAAGAAVFYAVLTRPVEGSLLLAALVPALAPRLALWKWQRADWLNVACLGTAYVAAVLVSLLVDWGRSGFPFVTGYEGTGWTTPLPIGLAGALVSPGRGLLWEFPAVVLVPFGVRRLFKEGRGVDALVFTGLATVQLLNVATWEAWWGGWDWGLRLFVPALPLLAVLATIGVTVLPSAIRLWLPGIVFLGGVVWAVPCVVTDLLGGYAGAYDGTMPSFSLLAYPPLGAWRFLHHLRATTLTDSGAVDIVWLRLAHYSHNLSLIPGAVFAFAALFLGALALRLERLPAAT